MATARRAAETHVHMCDCICICECERLSARTKMRMNTLIGTLWGLLIANGNGGMAERGIGMVRRKVSSTSN